MATQIWDSAYENIPADNDQASEGALRIRNLKRDVRERAEIDHDWDDVTDSGKHLQITFRDPLGADPADVVDEGVLYTKDVAAKVELFWKDEDGNVLQLTDVGKSLAFATGTLMLFQQTAAPTGWTKETTHDDKALRVVTGTASSGGTNAFSVALSTAFGSVSYTLLEADVPSHVHTGPSHAHGAGTLVAPVGAAGNFRGAAGGGVQSGSSAVTGSTSLGGTGDTGTFGGDGGHAHDVDLDVQYVDLIIAKKD